ncbi:MAG TPA: PEP/pyruvate-binding domain-containing protein [Glaciibacter sp.]|nr:PEP/pyruvate-binding domain-containing protein [Glaciibacter sp.]
MQSQEASAKSLILGFDEISEGMLAVAGGKAMNLGVLTRVGFSVPPGFCLSTSAYRRAVETSGLEELLNSQAADVPASASTLTEIARRAREIVLAVPFPGDVDASLRAAYAGLGRDVAVAVRSSATTEDLPSASFAGQQDTFLNVVGGDDVVKAARRCWASLWTDRAVAYRTLNGIDHTGVALAVVVQRMVNARVAGVLFTANPLTGRRHEAVIDASPGLGEAVVSGAVNPDHFVVDITTGEIAERRMGTKGLIIRPLEGGGTEQVHNERAGAEWCLSDTEARELASLGQQVESHYAAPQDIEWAIDTDGKLWLTQARPITTLFPVPSHPATVHRVTASSSRHPEPRVYFCLTLAQGLTRPITPMGLAGFRLIASSAARAAGFSVTSPRHGPSLWAEGAQRFFVDLTPVVRSSVGREIAPRILGVMEARSAVAIRRLFDDPRFSVTARARLPVVRRIGRVALHARVPLTVLRAVVRPGSALRAANQVGRRLAAALVVPDAATAGERLDHVERILGKHLFPLLPRVLPIPVVGFGMLALARKVVGDAAAPGDWQELLRGLPHNVTTGMDLALWDVARRIDSSADAAALFRSSSAQELAAAYASGVLPDEALAAVTRFLSWYGDRAVAEIDLGMPRWSDDPTHILGVLANYLRVSSTDQTPEEQFLAAAHAADAVRARLVAAASAQSRLRGAVARMALRRARELAGLRELPKHYLVMGLAAVRRQLAIIGAELANSGRIATADDIFFLDFAEVREGLGGALLQDRVAERRIEYERELRRRHIPRILLSDGTEVEALHTSGPTKEGTLQGTPASAGQATHAARVILDPVGAHLEPGEILVAPSTDPGWTPLFLTAGGLVMEMGGANSHGAVVAREYGIPAVVGVPDATLHLVTGQRITVDGAAGTVVPE